MKFSLLLAALVAGACIVQTHAGILDKIQDKVGDVKGALTGKEPAAEQKEAEAKEADEKKDDKYEGGFAKQVAHSMLDAGMDRAEHEAKSRYGNVLLKPIISMAADKIKDQLHEKVNDYGKKPEADKKEGEAAAQPKEGEEKKEGVLANLIEKVTRRKRSVDSAADKKKRGGLGKLAHGLKSKIVSLFKADPADTASATATTTARPPVNSEESKVKKVESKSDGEQNNKTAAAMEASELVKEATEKKADDEDEKEGKRGVEVEDKKPVGVEVGAKKQVDDVDQEVEEEGEEEKRADVKVEHEKDEEQEQKSSALDDSKAGEVEARKQADDDYSPAEHERKHKRFEEEDDEKADDEDDEKQADEKDEGEAEDEEMGKARRQVRKSADDDDEDTESAEGEDDDESENKVAGEKRAKKHGY